MVEKVGGRPCSDILGVLRSHLTRARASASATGALFGFATGVQLSFGDTSALIAVLSMVIPLLIWVRLVVTPERRTFLYGVTLLAFALRAAIAVALYAGSLVLGRRGFLVGDDEAYAQFAWALASYARGEPIHPWVPPFWNSDFHLFGLLTYLEAGLFYVIGFRPVVANLMNAALGAAAAPLIFEIARRTFGSRAATVSVMSFVFFPSVALWSAMNLKEGLSVFLLAGVYWALARFHASPTKLRFALVYLPLLPMQSLRQYLMILLSLVLPMGILMTPRLRAPSRFWWSVSGLAISSILLVANAAALRPDMLLVLEAGRRDRTAAARTAIDQGPPVVRAQAGDTFVVVLASSAPATPPPEGPRVVVVQPGTRLTVRDPSDSHEPSPGSAIIYPGDIVVVGDPGTTPKPADERQQIVVGTEGQAFRPIQLGGDLVIAMGRGADSLALTLAYIPRGLVYAVFAPFPFGDATYSRFTTPEQLAWYALMVCAIFTLWLERAHWRSYGPILLVIVGQLAVMTLIEGNVGTLYRHRGMIVPLTLVLAAPALLRSFDLVRARLRVRLVDQLRHPSSA